MPPEVKDSALRQSSVPSPRIGDFASSWSRFAALCLAIVALVPALEAQVIHETLRIQSGRSSTGNSGLFVVHQPGLTAAPTSIDVDIEVPADSQCLMFFATDANYRARNSMAFGDTFLLANFEWDSFFAGWGLVNQQPRVAFDVESLALLYLDVYLSNYGSAPNPGWGHFDCIDLAMHQLPPGGALYGQAMAAITHTGTPGVFASCGTSKAITIVSVAPAGRRAPAPALGTRLLSAGIEARLASDGRKLLVIGSPAPGPTAPEDAGLVFLSDPDTSPGLDNALVLHPPVPGTVGFGRTLHAADFDGDGFDELVVGAPHSAGPFDPIPSAPTGAVWVYNGRALSDWIAVARKASVPPAAPQPITVADPSTSSLVAELGSSFESVDLSGDGILDLAIGAPNRFDAVPIFGQRRGAVILVPGQDLVAVGGTTIGSALLIPNTAISGQAFGAAMTSGQALGGQSFLVVGAPNSSNADGSTGNLHIYTAPSTPGLPVRVGGVIRPNQSLARQFGHQLVAGDFDADGDHDIAVAANEWDGSGPRVVVLDTPSLSTTSPREVLAPLTSGSPSFGGKLATEDMNEDGAADLIVLDIAGLDPATSTSTGVANVWFGHRTQPMGRPYNSVVLAPEIGKSLLPFLTAVAGTTANAPRLLLWDASAGTPLLQFGDLLHRRNNVLAR